MKEDWRFFDGGFFDGVCIDWLVAFEGTSAE
jgi:hypothetical protein